MKIYLSSTFIDLRRHREKLGRVLRKAGYEVVMMEEYVARDTRVEFACRGDVVACDVYVGLFAWRYGYVPDQNNPDHLSVTEMEYLAAGSKPMTRLTFLLKDKARWQETLKDADPSRINVLRTLLKAKCSAYFSNADELSHEVLAALRVHESTQVARQLEAIDVMLAAQQLGSSYMTNIGNKMKLFEEAPFVEFRIAPIPWWNTRLYLVASLAVEFGHTLGFVFVDDDNRFILMAAPSEICHRLALRWPILKKGYENFRKSVATLDQLKGQLWRYPLFVNEALGADEEAVKHSLSTNDLVYELGIFKNAEVVDVNEKNQRFLQREILGRQTRFVALLRNRRLEGLVDREMLAQRVAQAVLS